MRRYIHTTESGYQWVVLLPEVIDIVEIRVYSDGTYRIDTGKSHIFTYKEEFQRLLAALHEAERGYDALFEEITNESE